MLPVLPKPDRSSRTTEGWAEYGGVGSRRQWSHHTENSHEEVPTSPLLQPSRVVEIGARCCSQECSPGMDRLVGVGLRSARVTKSPVRDPVLVRYFASSGRWKRTWNHRCRALRRSLPWIRDARNDHSHNQGRDVLGDFSAASKAHLLMLPASTIRLSPRRDNARQYNEPTWPMRFLTRWPRTREGQPVRSAAMPARQVQWGNGRTGTVSRSLR